MKLNEWSWARFFARWVLGLIFFMAGVMKVFDMTAIEHARRYFVSGFADMWIPVWLLWMIGFLIPFVELVAGAFMCLGLRVKNSGIALGFVLIIVTYGHLLKEPLYDTTSHIFPRLVLLYLVLMVPRSRDVLSVDHWLARNRPTA